MDFLEQSLLEILYDVDLTTDQAVRLLELGYQITNSGWTDCYYLRMVDGGHVAVT